jgi:hypothetical protein
MSRQWTWAPTNIPPKCKLTKGQKQALQAEADQFVAAFYKPTFIRPPEKRPRVNYVVDFATKWHGPYLQFIAQYACPGPYALSPFFEIAFARLGYFSHDNWNLWVRRHTGQWIVMDRQLTLAQCFKKMRSSPWFHH